jgi:RimJ/RimL family protein N-acetyltransferase
MLSAESLCTVFVCLPIQKNMRESSSWMTERPCCLGQNWQQTQKCYGRCSQPYRRKAFASLSIPSHARESSNGQAKSTIKRHCPIVCLIQETRQKIVAVASLEFSDVLAEKHKAEFGITVHDDFQNKGIGTTLTKHMICIARNKRLRKITLKVLTRNKKAIHVYKKCGFKIEAKLRKESLINGRYYDDYIMSMFL